VGMVDSMVPQNACSFGTVSTFPRRFQSRYWDPGSRDVQLFFRKDDFVSCAHPGK